MDLTDLTLTRRIAAPPAAVFDVWLDAKSPGSPWFGSERVILNPVVDGLFFHSVSHEGKSWTHYGRFVRLERPGLIEHTWVSEATKGVESVVTLSLDPTGDETVVTLRHAHVPDDPMGRQHQDGWGFILSAIAQRLARR